jgi:hypothetical protein
MSWSRDRAAITGGPSIIKNNTTTNCDVFTVMGGRYTPVEWANSISNQSANKWRLVRVSLTKGEPFVIKGLHTEPKWNKEVFELESLIPE